MYSESGGPAGTRVIYKSNTKVWHGMDLHVTCIVTSEMYSMHA